MNDNELKQLWREQELAAAPAIPDTELVKTMKKKMRKFDRTIFWRDARELAACVFIFCVFGYELTRRHSMLTHAGSLVIVLSAVFIGWKLIAARRAHPPISESASMGDFARAELAKVRHQARLLQSVLWWYLLPLLVGVELFELGFSGPVAMKISMFVTNTAVYAFIYWLNLFAVRKQLTPLIQELEDTLNSVPEFGSQSNTSNPNP